MWVRNIILFNLLAGVFSFVWAALNDTSWRVIMREAFKHYFSFVGLCLVIFIIVKWVS